MAGRNGICGICNKRCYVMESIAAEDVVFHKTCFRCNHCNKVLSLGSYAALSGKYYCKPHFKQLFKLRGNYSEGFGTEKHSRKWISKEKREDNVDNVKPKTSTTSKVEKSIISSSSFPISKHKSEIEEVSELRRRRRRNNNNKEKKKDKFEDKDKMEILEKRDKNMNEIKPKIESITNKWERLIEEKQVNKQKEMEKIKRKRIDILSNSNSDDIKKRKNRESDREDNNKKEKREIPTTSSPSLHFATKSRPLNRGRRTPSKKVTTGRKKWIGSMKTQKDVNKGSITVILNQMKFHLSVVFILIVLYVILLYNGFVLLPKWMR